MISFRTFLSRLHEAVDATDPDGDSFSTIIQNLSQESDRTLASRKFWVALAAGLQKHPYVQRFRVPVRVVSLTNYRHMLGNSRGRGTGVYIEMREWHTKTWQKKHEWTCPLDYRTNTRKVPTGIFVTAGYSTTWDVGAGRLVTPTSMLIDDAREYQGLYNIGDDPSVGHDFAQSVVTKIDLYLRHWQK